MIKYQNSFLASNAAPKQPTNSTSAASNTSGAATTQANNDAWTQYW
jgi:hypothetical protein